MPDFDENDPFPLVESSKYSYRDAQVHAALVDKFLGLRTDDIESKLQKPSDGQQWWIGLPVQTLLTPYIELRLMLETIKPQTGETVIDCGAAYGRMGFVLGRHYPGVNFIGYEVVAERVTEAQRCLALSNCPRSRIVTEDLVDPNFSLPEAEFYFIYDFGHRRAIDDLLARLQNIAISRKITVVARGRSSRDAIDHGQPWLSQVNLPEHFQNFSIYRS